MLLRAARAARAVSLARRAPRRVFVPCRTAAVMTVAAETKRARETPTIGTHVRRPSCRRKRLAWGGMAHHARRGSSTGVARTYQTPSQLQLPVCCGASLALSAGCLRESSRLHPSLSRRAGGAACPTPLPRR